MSIYLNWLNPQTVQPATLPAIAAETVASEVRMIVVQTPLDFSNAQPQDEVEKGLLAMSNTLYAAHGQLQFRVVNEGSAYFGTPPAGRIVSGAGGVEFTLPAISFVRYPFPEFLKTKVINGEPGVIPEWKDPRRPAQMTAQGANLRIRAGHAANPPVAMSLDSDHGIGFVIQKPMAAEGPGTLTMSPSKYEAEPLVSVAATGDVTFNGNFETDGLLHFEVPNGPDGQPDGEPPPAAAPRGLRLRLVDKASLGAAPLGAVVLATDSGSGKLWFAVQTKAPPGFEWYGLPLGLA